MAANVPVEEGRLVNESCFELLAFEMVHLMRDVSALTDFDQDSSLKSANTSTERRQNYEFEAEQVVLHKLEGIGYRVGVSLVEKLTRDLPRFSDHMEAVKFICKEFWTLLFKKQIDNLKTNHKGTFVLQDNNFKWFSRMSAQNRTETINKVTPYVSFPCGLIRGALSNLGIQAVVSNERTQYPTCVFKIVIHNNK